MKTHGESPKGNTTPEYFAWCRMIQRCTNPNERQWKDYGGRGIKVCDEWRNNYPRFLEVIGRRPSPRHTLDRYPNNDGNYEPGNVRWATRAEQQRNTRRNRMVTFNGETKCVREWASIYGISERLLARRLALDYPFEKATHNGRFTNTVRQQETVHRGSDNGNSRLSESEVRVIKTLFKIMSHRQISKIYEVDKATIGRIARGETWGHIV